VGMHICGLVEICMMMMDEDRCPGSCGAEQVHEGNEMRCIGMRCNGMEWNGINDDRENDSMVVDK
jgi:hypothetical protein